MLASTEVLDRLYNGTHSDKDGKTDIDVIAAVFVFHEPKSRLWISTR